MKIEYLLFNVIIFLLSTLSILFYKGARFPQVRLAILAILIIAVPYLIWDFIVTDWWWQFNEKFILSYRVGRLPIEEILFFFVIPWSSLLIWENLKLRVTGRTKINMEFLMVTIAVALLCYSLVNELWYSLSISLLMMIFSLASALYGNWIRQKVAQVYFVVIFLLICVFNGYLTARPVVMYNTLVKTNLQVFTIPAEDIVYGLVLVGLISLIYDWHTKKLIQFHHGST